MAEYAVCPHCHNPLSQREWARVVRCRDCKHAHITVDGKYCKWCSIMATHQIESDEYVDPPNGYDPEPYFSADFFCANGELRDGE